ncbi:MAG: DEAD/DEAH box helicase, partial [Planctomycetota bacterium]
MPYLDEAQVEIQTIEWLKELDYDYVYGPDIGPDMLIAEREDYAQVVLTERLHQALSRINPDATPEIIEEAVRKVTRPESPSLIENNRWFHRLLTDGVDVPFVEDGQERHFKVWLIDADEVSNNEFLAINQFTVIEHKNRRPDVIVFINGLPIVVIELKNPADEKATIKKAYNQLQTYKDDIPGLFAYNELLVISDGLSARAGTLSAGPDRFMAWRTIDGVSVAPTASVQLEVMINGLFDKQRLIDFLMNFVVFEDDGGQIVKKAAAYHQYHAVNKALDCTVTASRPDGDQRIGVIWHTQGSGKSLTMAFYAGKMIKRAEMENPTIVVITDRNDLDDQLFGTFCGCKDLLRQTPVQADSRTDLRQKLKVTSGGIVFTTIQKFLPERKGDHHPQLSDRRNIVVIADEAHRSQYDFIDGYARHMRDALPDASFIGFTGTPIERHDKSTQAVFGDHIDTYDIQRAVEDRATVRIYYESRLARIELNEQEKPTIDPEFEEITEAEEEENRRQRLRSK